MTPEALAATLRVLDAMLAREPWRVSLDDIAAARELVAKLAQQAQEAG
jgi:hypothetical protein